jgi:hypothetical protein
MPLPASGAGFPVTGGGDNDEMCTVCAELEAIRHRVGNLTAGYGAVAQFGRAPAWHAGGREFKSHQLHTLRTWGTTFREVGYLLAGVVAGEGSFTTGRQGTYADGSDRIRFVFTVKMATRDRSVLEALRTFLGYGSIHDERRRQAHWQPMSSFQINSRRGHHAATIPFADAFLLPCYKRDQFEAWSEAFLANEAAHPSQFGKGRSVCSIGDCVDPVRGRGLCRKHYYRATGW